MTDLYQLVVAQRLALSDTLDTLSEPQWNTASLCSGWTARDVLSHLTLPATASKVKVFVAFAKSGFNLDKMTMAMVRADTQTGPELATKFRATAQHRWTPPTFGFEAPLTDAVAHGSDICRPLGLTNTVSPEAARAVLDFLVTKKATNGFIPKDRVLGFRFETTDLNWGFGRGPLVSGPAEAIILAILGRDAAFQDLTGDGVATLQARNR